MLFAFFEFNMNIFFSFIHFRNCAFIEKFMFYGCAHADIDKNMFPIDLRFFLLFGTNRFLAEVVSILELALDSGAVLAYVAEIIASLKSVTVACCLE